MIYIDGFATTNTVTNATDVVVTEEILVLPLTSSSSNSTRQHSPRPTIKVKLHCKDEAMCAGSPLLLKAI